MNYYIEKACIVKKKIQLEGWILDPNAKIDIVNRHHIIQTLTLNKKRKDISNHFHQKEETLGFSYELSLPKFSRKLEIILRTDTKEIDRIFLDDRLIKRLANKCKRISTLIAKTARVLMKNPKILFSRKLISKYKKVFFDKYYGRNVDNSWNPFDQKEYIEWIIKKEVVEKEKKEYQYQPKISFVLPVYNPRLEDLKACIESIQHQTYENYEICIVDDCSTKKEIIDYLKELESQEKIKIHFNKTNMHIAKTTNQGIKQAEGELIAFIDHDDTIAENALMEVIKVLNKEKKIDFFYSDFDKLDKKGIRCCPYFKPDYSPDTLLSFNYLSHFNVIRKQIIEKVGGFREKYRGAQDYDLYLRITEITNRIYHIPKILYHWRMAENSTSLKKSSKDYAYINGKKAIESALKRRKINGEVQTQKESSFYTVNYHYKKEPKVSILIPTRDYADVLEKCVDSVLKKTTYQNYEIIIINNGSKERKTLELLEKYNKNDKIMIYDNDCEFNFSYLNNEAVKKCQGDYIVLLNNDTEILTNHWLETMVGYAMQPHIGAVGVKLLYYDNTIQHGGVVLGLGGVASHTFLGEPRNYKAFNGLLEVPTNYAAVTAACLMVSKKKYLEIGGLEEKLKVAYNDIDFCIKLLEKGYYNVFLPQVELYHFESKTRGLDTTGEKYERFLQESAMMMKKWKKYIERDPFYNENYSLKSAFRLDSSSKGSDQNESKNQSE